MFSYLAKRIILSLVTLLVILLTSYVLLRLAPGDPARSSVFGDDAGSSNLSSEKGVFAENRALKAKLHLDKPIMTGFAIWMRDIVTRGDFGASAVVDPGKPVTTLILERLPVTLRLNVLAVLLTYVVAIVLGVYTAVRADSGFDRTISVLLFVLYSLPVMWTALLLQAMFCEGGRYPVFPLKGLVVPDPWRYDTWQLLQQSAMHYILPVFCLSYAGLAGLSRYARNGMLEVLNCDYVRTARAKGASEFTVIWGHAFRNGLITLITLFGGLLPSLVAGSVLVEYVFNIPGMGALSMLALTSRDYPLIMALFAFGGALTLLGILISDLLYAVADPRISLTGGRNNG